MCGRFVRASPEEVIREEFGIASAATIDLRPRYNIAPGDSVAAVVQDGEGRRLGALRWGFLPASAPPGSSAATVINARGETVRRRFRDSFSKRRCLLVADGFYEWRRSGATKTPYFIYLKSRRPLGFAAIWHRTGPSRIPACSILTCRPNELVAELHDRMPVVLGLEARDHWLDPGADATGLESLLVPYRAEEMAAHPVSTLVNSARNDSPQCVQPLTGGTLRLVSKTD